MKPDNLDVMKENDIVFSNAAGFWSGPIEIECPSEIRQGVYQIDKIGAFSYMGGKSTHMLHIESIGRFCSIAGNVVSGAMEHPTEFLSAHPIMQGALKWKALDDFKLKNKDMLLKSRNTNNETNKQRFGKIKIGNDVWIGEGAFIRRGVKIGDGAIIASHSLVSKDVAPYSIVGGVPAKHIRFRFERSIIDQLIELEWWNYGLSALEGVDFTDISQAIKKIKENIDSGVAKIFTPDVVRVDKDGVTEKI
ncbi:CatB-related O-acetyltransferase [Enterobacter asburiae]|uniref:CatB-related O-acetyltransferase n=1 Tax=Enterobacter asburiae TaxID=61645 RepID=UPI003CF10E99